MTKEEYPELSRKQHEARVRGIMLQTIRKTVGSENEVPNDEAVVLTAQYLMIMGWTDREYFKRVDRQTKHREGYNLVRNEAQVAVQNVYDIYKVMIDARPRCDHVEEDARLGLKFATQHGYCGEMSCHNYAGKAPQYPTLGDNVTDINARLNLARDAEGGQWLK